MIGPRKGGKSPTAVETPMSHGSAKRRRASLNVQYAVASQRSPRTRIAALRAQVQSVETARTDAVTAEACPPNSRVQRPRRQLRQRRRARTSGRRASHRPASRDVLRSGEVAEQVER